LARQLVLAKRLRDLHDAGRPLEGILHQHALLDGEAQVVELVLILLELRRQRILDDLVDLVLGDGHAHALRFLDQQRKEVGVRVDLRDGDGPEHDVRQRAAHEIHPLLVEDLERLLGVVGLAAVELVGAELADDGVVAAAHPLEARGQEERDHQQHGNDGENLFAVVLEKFSHKKSSGIFAAPHCAG
jgi:hypothetical protein